MHDAIQYSPVFARRDSERKMNLDELPGQELTIYGLGMLSIYLVGRRMLGLAKEDEEDKHAMKDELKALHGRVSESETGWKVCEAERASMQQDIDDLRKRVEGKHNE